MNSHRKHFIDVRGVIKKFVDCHYKIKPLKINQ